MSLLPQDQDQRFLARALELARAAVGRASPNPTVGCVLARGNTVLGEGAHLYDARDHAEIVALKQAASLGHSVRGATAYVTLEPCAHHGRTGPCADALIAEKISRCVIATADPNPMVRGQGLAKLRVAGVEIEVSDPASALAIEARRLNDAFAYSIQHHRPFVTLKAAVSIDGMIAPAHRSRPGPVWITGPAARKDVQNLRHVSDAILTGIGTVLADNPALTDRTGLPRRRPLLRVILDSNLRTPLDAQVADSISNDLLFFTTEHASSQAESLQRLQGAQIQRLPESAPGQIDLASALSALHQRDIRSVLVEGGTFINASFLQSDLVDRVVLYFTEFELGLDGVPFARGLHSPYELQERLTSLQRKEIPHSDGSRLEDIRISGYLHDPWADFSS
jgi:diaminohydroxyphosphoribosylaminopyrimidine deaminase/5-amino-6-(5-phosphoribosylamino)uracil reductase